MLYQSPNKTKPCACCMGYAHYNDVIMGTMASHLTSLTIVYSTVYSDEDQSSQMGSNAENVTICWRHHAPGQSNLRRNKALWYNPIHSFGITRQWGELWGVVCEFNGQTTLCPSMSRSYYRVVFDGDITRVYSITCIATVPNVDRWVPRTKGPVTRKVFPFDDVIMNIFITMGTLQTTLCIYYRHFSLLPLDEFRWIADKGWCRRLSTSS